ncbi:MULTISPECIES: hypothetical protein [unclassified Streptomyces]|uniref:hypothetical protein n=1 Tax=unclassified Streptomyces TaxID=2593676 RepID=UPI0036C6E524
MGVRTAVGALIEEAEQQLHEQGWDLTPGDRDLALATATRLQQAVGHTGDQEALADLERLAHLREVLAALAIALARTHGRLAWFLAACIEALSPVLHWRALPSGGGRNFDTSHPTPGQFAEAEGAVRQLTALLLRIAA